MRRGGAPRTWFQDPDGPPTTSSASRWNLANAARRADGRAGPCRCRGQWDRLLELLRARRLSRWRSTGVELAEEKKRVGAAHLPVTSWPRRCSRSAAATPPPRRGRYAGPWRGRRVGHAARVASPRAIPGARRRGGPHLRRRAEKRDLRGTSASAGRTPVLLGRAIAHYYGDLEESLERGPRRTSARSATWMAVRQSGDGACGAGAGRGDSPSLAKDGTLREAVPAWWIWNDPRPAQTPRKTIPRRPPSPPSTKRLGRAAVGEACRRSGERVRGALPADPATAVRPAAARDDGWRSPSSPCCWRSQPGSAGRPPAVATVPSAGGARLAAAYVEFFRGTPAAHPAHHGVLRPPGAGHPPGPVRRRVHRAGAQLRPRRRRRTTAPGWRSVPAGQAEASRPSSELTPLAGAALRHRPPRRRASPSRR